MGQDAVHASVQKHMSGYVSITQEEKIFLKIKALWNKDQQQECNQVKYTDYKTIVSEIMK